MALGSLPECFGGEKTDCFLKIFPFRLLLFLLMVYIFSYIIQLTELGKSIKSDFFCLYLVRFRVLSSQISSVLSSQISSLSSQISSLSSQHVILD